MESNRLNMESQDYVLKRIANHLMLNSSFLSEIGLYEGKMGIVVFFFHYARYTGNPLYSDFAEELLNEIYAEISVYTPITFAGGLCGIGWGVLHLLENKFVEGSPDEILREIDDKIRERDVQWKTDLSIETGLGGIFLYVQKRLDNCCFNSVFDEFYLGNLKNTVNLPSEILLLSFISETSISENVKEWKFGLYGGCAGWGLKMMLT